MELVLKTGEQKPAGVWVIAGRVRQKKRVKVWAKAWACAVSRVEEKEREGVCEAVSTDLKAWNSMKHIFAIPLENGRLCSHFGHCEQFAVVETENNGITGEKLLIPPPHEPGLLPGWLAKHGVTDVIAGGMGQRAISLFTAHNIRVNVGALPRSPRELVSDWLNDTLVTGSNACDH